MSSRIGRTLGGFHQRLAHRLTGRQPWRGIYERFVYPPLVKAMSEVGLQEVNTYASRHYNTVAQYIVTRPIMYLSMAVEIHLGTRVSKRWWYQEGLDMVGMRTLAQEA